MRGLRLGVETTIENELSEMILMKLPIYSQKIGEEKKLNRIDIFQVDSREKCSASARCA